MFQTEVQNGWFQHNYIEKLNYYVIIRNSKNLIPNFVFLNQKINFL